MNTPIPVLNRFFQIEIQGLPNNGPPEVFYSIRGLNAAAIRITETYSPGGFDKNFELPNAHQAGTLILKRPLVKDKTNLTKWCEESLEKLSFKPTLAQIFVLDRSGGIVTQWEAKDTYPVGIESSALGLEQGNGIVEETITLAYASLVRS